MKLREVGLGLLGAGVMSSRAAVRAARKVKVVAGKFAAACVEEGKDLRREEPSLKEILADPELREELRKALEE